LYRIGDKETPEWNQLKRHLNGKGYRVSIYEGTDSLEKHLQNVNRINREKASLLLAMSLALGDTDAVLVAVSDARPGTGRFLAIEEIPAAHEAASKELAVQVAMVFKTQMKRLPLFPLLGVDMPGIFLGVECTKERTTEVFDRLYEGLQKYFARSRENEN